MDLVEILRRKRRKVTEIPKWGTYLRKQWEHHFASSISDSEKKSIFLDEFLWHIFSYEKVACFHNDEAKKVFHNEKKNQCFVFYQHSNDALILERPQNISAADFFK